MYDAHTNTTLFVSAFGPSARATLLALGLGASAAMTALATTAQADASNCGVTFDPSASYPGLPATPGVDVSGEDGISLHLQHARGVVELDGCLYELDRALNVGFGGLGQLQLLFELHGVGAQSLVFVSEDGAAPGVVEVAGDEFDHAISPGPSEIGFELGSLGQSAPTTPVVVIKPIEDDPPPD